MDDKAQLEALAQLGLTQYEARVYLALQGEDAAPVSRLQRKSGVPSGGVYTALAGLVERGFAELVLGTKKAYRCVPPAQALENHRRALDRKIEELKEEREESVARAKAVLERLASTAPQPAGDPTSLGIRLVASRHATQLYKELSATDKELLMCVTAPAVPSSDDEQVRRTRGKRKAARFLVDSAVLEDPALRERSLTHALAMGNVRFEANLPLRFTVFDRKVVILEMVEPDESWQLLVIPNAAMAEQLAGTFEHLWAAATPAEKIKTEPSRRRQSGA